MGRTSPPSTTVLGSGAKSFPYASLIVARRAPLFNTTSLFREVSSGYDFDLAANLTLSLTRTTSAYAQSKLKAYKNFGKLLVVYLHRAKSMAVNMFRDGSYHKYTLFGKRRVKEGTARSQMLTFTYFHTLTPTHLLTLTRSTHQANAALSGTPKALCEM